MFDSVSLPAFERKARLMMAAVGSSRPSVT